jgi:hypothetical protein
MAASGLFPFSNVVGVVARSGEMGIESTACRYRRLRCRSCLFSRVGSFEARGGNQVKVQGKVCIVTGTARGIGEAIARRYAKEWQGPAFLPRLVV